MLPKQAIGGLNPHRDAPSSDTTTITGSIRGPLQVLSNELLTIIIEGLASQDRLSVAKTCREMSTRVLPTLYKLDTANNTVPFALQWACWSGSLATAKASLVASKALQKDCKEIFGTSFSRYELASFLARSGVTSFLLAREWDLCLLHVSCLRGNTAIAELLLQNGAEVNQTSTKGKTALHFATNEGVARFLVERGADINGKDAASTTPIANIITLGRYLELEQGWESYHRAYDRAIEHCDIIPGITLAVQYLILKGADFSLATCIPGQEHPLSAAIFFGNAEVVKVLLDAGASPNPRDTQTGQRVLLVARSMRVFNGLKITNMLLEAGAEVDYDPSKPIPNPVQAFDVPITASFQSEYAREKEWTKVIEKICTRMADINAKIGSRTPLAYAVKQGRIDIARILMRYGATWGSAGEFLSANVIKKLLAGCSKPTE